jgi:hypothetical protein
VVYIATSRKATTEALTNFVPVSDPDIQYGSGVDQITPGQFDDSIRGFGDEVLGKCDGCWIVEWTSLPAGYMIAHARGALQQNPAARVKSPADRTAEDEKIKYISRLQMQKMLDLFLLHLFQLL